MGVLCLYLFCYAILCVHSSFAIIVKRKLNLVALLVLSYRCIVTINVVWFFHTVPWVGLQCMIVVFPDHSHLLFIYCLMGVLCLSLFWYALLCILSSFAIILKRERGLVAFLCFYCFTHVLIVTVNVLWLFLVVPWVCLQCVIVVFPNHTHLLFDCLAFPINSLFMLNF